MSATKEEAKKEIRVIGAEFVAGAVETSGLPAPTVAEVAFAGRSNVGKSSLLNAMMQRHGLARTSRTPGCTRQLNIFEVKCADGLVLRFVDLPGYGWAKRSKSERGEWQGMIEGYLKTRASLKAVAILVDVRRGPEEEEEQLVEFLGERRLVSSAKPLEVILGRDEDRQARGGRAAARPGCGEEGGRRGSGRVQRRERRWPGGAVGEDPARGALSRTPRSLPPAQRPPGSACDPLARGAGLR